MNHIDVTTDDENHLPPEDKSVEQQKKRETGAVKKADANADTLSSVKEEQAKGEGNSDEHGEEPNMNTMLVPDEADEEVQEADSVMGDFDGGNVSEEPSTMLAPEDEAVEEIKEEAESVMGDIDGGNVSEDAIMKEMINEKEHLEDLDEGCHESPGMWYFGGHQETSDF
jgi:hypothetical protein